MKKRVVGGVRREVTEMGVNRKKPRNMILFLWLHLKTLSDLIRCTGASARIGLEKHTMDVV
jgi:hypothetical protein